ncbi:MAG: glycerol kinase GlpK [Alphaproteobacteria bacterium]
MPEFVLAIDQGTTSSRAILFDRNYAIRSISQKEFTQHFPRSGWVEHDPDEIWETVVSTCREAMVRGNATAADIAAIGITNQRETIVIWDRVTGAPISKAIVWQDRRTSGMCTALRDSGQEPIVTAKTGLLLDPYFSGTKIAWLLDNVEGARESAMRGELAFGTIDSFLIWRLTGGRVHATDATNASRTLLYNIHEGGWDDELLELLRVPRAILPDVLDSAAGFGDVNGDILGGPIAIRGVAGDQQAAMIGQACFQPGMMKSTYGTGCFALLNTGAQAASSKNRMLTTIAYQLDGVPTYALEGSIFIAGAAVQWLRDGLGIIEHAAQTGAMAQKADPAQDVYLVPAFTGLGAPHWDAEARGVLSGLTRATGPNELARAALESVCYQTRDLLEAMASDWPGAASKDTVLRVDGGMVVSDWTMQCLADFLAAPIERPHVLETTALGAAWLAGMGCGFYPGPDEFAAEWRHERRFEPVMSETDRNAKYAGWKDALRRTLTP